MRHLFFDLDRTLWDFENNSAAALKLLYSNFLQEHSIKNFESFHKTYTQNNARLWNRYGKGKMTKEDLRIKRFRDTLQQFQIFDESLAQELADQYVSISPHQTILLPNAHDTLKELKKDGYQLHIITNGFKEVQHIKLDKSELSPYFDLILCSEEVGKSKPAKEVFQFALAETQAKSSESVMIGDDLNVDILGALNAGMEGILFDPNANYKSGVHEWHIDDLSEIPLTLQWIKQSRF
jgi:putative hydrolase of the HAD superfamily